MTDRHRLPSISKNLTLSLTLIVAIVSITLIGFNYYTTSRNAQAQLNKKADEYISFLISSLSIPLWNFEVETIRHIGSVYSQNELVGALKITGYDKEVYFNTEKDDSRLLVKREKTIFYNDRPVGAVQLSLSPKTYMFVQKQLLRHSVIAVLGILIAIIVATGFFLRMFLEKPLIHLSGVMEAYASGTYDELSTKPRICSEFQGILTVLGEMNEKIVRQMTDLQKAEEKYRLLVEELNDVIFHTDQNGICTYISPVVQSVTGHDPSDLIGLHFTELIYDKDKDLVISRFKKLISGVIKPSEFRIANKLHEPIWVRSSSKPIYDGENVVGVRGVFTNISEERRLKSQLGQAHKMEAIGTLTGGIAHDFNNILGIILGNTELALDDVPEWNPAYFNLEEIRSACLRAKDVVRQLLSFARKADQEKKPIRFIPVIEDSIKLLLSTMPKTIAIRKNIQAESDTVLADATQLHQIMINLCTNAYHAMEETEGILEIGIANVFLDEDATGIDLDLTRGEHIKLTITDNGEGIDPEIIDRIFDPYFTTKKMEKGTGIGLSMVHGIVKSYGGAITVASELGKGTAFHIYLPITEKDITLEAEIAEELPVGNESILLVDDEESIIDVGRQILERLGYKVKAITDPVEALEIFRANPDQFDLVITDMTMPRMTGEMLIREILNICPDTPIILCTGFHEKMTEEKAKKIGVCEYIEKPIDKRKFALKVRKALDEN